MGLRVELLQLLLGVQKLFSVLAARYLRSVLLVSYYQELKRILW